jgi:hypothetical protein
MKAVQNKELIITDDFKKATHDKKIRYHKCLASGKVEDRVYYKRNMMIPQNQDASWTQLRKQTERDVT